MPPATALLTPAEGASSRLVKGWLIFAAARITA